MTKYTDTLNIRLSKYFASLIFVGKGRRRKFFNGEKFPIYGIYRLYTENILGCFMKPQLTEEEQEPHNQEGG